MPITLITGANGHGKGQVIIRKILELQEENDALEKEGKPRRRIFSNIHGVNEPDRTPLKDVKPIPSDKIFFGKQDNPDMPPPDGYWLPDVGDIFIYDECQRIEWVKQKAGALSTDIRVTSLEEHRHWGLDIFFLTQSPNYIHSHIQGLVSPHWYVERPLGLPITNVFIFNKYQAKPETPSVKKRADDQKQITLGKKYGQYYKSSAEHNMKSSIPLKIKIAVAALIFCIGFTAYKWTKTKYYDKDNGSPTASASQPVNNTSAPAPASSAPAPSASLADALKQLDLENQLAIAKQENELLKARLNSTYIAESNNPQIRVAAVYTIDGICRAYNAAGGILSMSNDECNSYFEAGRMVRVQSKTSLSPVPMADSVTSTQISPVTTVQKDSVKSNL